MGYQITRPDAEQLKFNSSANGPVVLDEYLEAVELGGRTLAALLLDLFNSSGVLRTLATPAEVATAISAAAAAAASQIYAENSAIAAAASAASIASGPVTSVNSKTGIVTLVKNDIGLGNADNTSDANKPISSATQSALNAKQALIAVVKISAGAQIATTGNDYWLEGVACAVTAPAPVDGARFAVTPANGLKTNTIDFGAATVRGPNGTATGVITIDLGARMEFIYSSTISQWVML